MLIRDVREKRALGLDADASACSGVRPTAAYTPSRAARLSTSLLRARPVPASAPSGISSVRSFVSAISRRIVRDLRHTKSALRRKHRLP